ncbi:MAG: hypothetical protein KatS3mg113_0293 [Planctomycetaceae bacterium]|nr:MAG: hypothetical protein KatS3mg113_0293 [Planctomycetaceae bacterium]
MVSAMLPGFLDDWADHHHMLSMAVRWVRVSCIYGILIIGSILGTIEGIGAQETFEGKYFLWNHTTPPGVAGAWSLQSGRVAPGTFQTVVLRLPGPGQVAVHDERGQLWEWNTPVQFGLLVGPVYRLRLRSLANFPHAEFYPSLELIDHLHPPAGQAARYPVEIEFLPEELLAAQQGRLVTKVVYVERADHFTSHPVGDSPRVIDLPPQAPLLAEADLLGKPLVIVRLGGREPARDRPDPQFWGPLAPILRPEQLGPGAPRYAAEQAMSPHNHRVGPSALPNMTR